MSDVMLKSHYWYLLRSSKLSWFILLVLFVAIANDFCSRLWISAEVTAKKVADQVPSLHDRELPLGLLELSNLWPVQQSSIEQSIEVAEQAPNHSVFADKEGNYKLMAVFASAEQQGEWLARVKFTPSANVSDPTQTKDLLVKRGDSIGRFIVETIYINQLQLKVDDQLVNLYLFKPTSREEALK